MNKNLVIVVALVVIALVIVGAVTGWFGITGKVANSGQEFMREGTIYRINYDRDKFIIDVLSIQDNGQVALNIKYINNTDQSLIGEQTITALSNGEPVQLNPKLESAIVTIGLIKQQFGWDYAHVRLEEA